MKNDVPTFLGRLIGLFIMLNVLMAVICVWLWLAKIFFGLI